MKQLKTYNKKKHLLTEDNRHLLDETTAVGAVGGFTGRGGQDVDTIFAGGFHPEFGDLRSLLIKQIEDDIAKRMFTDDETPE